jgi:uncharacterized membrane protein
LINSIDEYLSSLKHQMAGFDRASIQDALSDAEEYLRNALAGARNKRPDITEAEALIKIIDGYGMPEEVAMAYKQMEQHIPSGFGPSAKNAERSMWARFFGVVIEPKAWAAGLFMLFSLATGIFYFTWAVTGISVSASLLILIIGIPLAGVFLLSVRGIALMEGRLVEALLGIRMPRRPLFSNKELSLWGRLKYLVTDRYTWTAMVYVLLMLPLGIIYFTLFVTLLSLSLWLIVGPILEHGFGIPAFTFNSAYYFPAWLIPFSVISGILLGVVSLHLFKLMGKMHGNFAKAMLVRN